ncbi:MULTISPECIES: hypothetical protein [unclassified Inquilinus]|uniref:hypothetical protein n=1 Tax=unclassified Inquilinus TaxID=2645927 RepID=UPI003F933DAC
MSNEIILCAQPPLLADEPVLAPDTVLAEALGYAHARSVRVLIKRHLAMLETLGPLHRRDAMVAIGSGAQRKTTVFDLNEAQCDYLILAAQTKRANVERAKVAELRGMFRRGALVAKDSEAVAELAAIQERHVERLSDAAAMKAASRIMKAGRRKLPDWVRTKQFETMEARRAAAMAQGPATDDTDLF